MKYETCTDYWLDTKDWSFKGEFEEMYRDIDDPWGCQKYADSLNNRIFLELLFDGNKRYKRILDIGCGLGGFTHNLFLKNSGGEVIGCDISSTAIKKASNLYPKIKFVTKNILTDEIDNMGMFNLVILSELIWYILDGIEEVFKKIEKVLSKDGTVGIHQYFLDNQRYGKEIINGLFGFENFLQNKTNFQIDKKVVSYIAADGSQADGCVLLATLKRRE
jgi:SAM-dependent methyltransferase